MTRPAVIHSHVISRRSLGNDYHSMVIGPIPGLSGWLPGQFVHMKIAGFGVYFRRAFSVASVEVGQESISIIFRALGRGTRSMAGLRKGDPIDMIGPLGNSFDLPSKQHHAIMIAGGIGFPPLYYLAVHLVANGHDPSLISFVYGGRTATDVLYRSRIKSLGLNFVPVTEDGTLGHQGIVIDPLDGIISKAADGAVRLYACGPEAMLKAVDALARARNLEGQLSLEAPMPCGIGVCLGCVVPLRAGGHARVCHDGPVFDIGEVML